MQQAILRGIHAPRFSGREEDCKNFKKEFREYCKNLNPTRISPEEEILALFMQAITSRDVKDLELLKAEKEGKLSFGQALQYLDEFYDRNREISIRKNWTNCNYPTQVV